MNIERALHIADGYNGNVKVGVAAPEHEAIVCLAAEVRRLRHDLRNTTSFPVAAVRPVLVSSDK